MTDRKGRLEKLIEDRELTDEQVIAIIDNITAPPPTPEIQEHHWSDKHIRFGLCGDFHIGSRFEDLDSLKDLFRRFKRRAVEAVYITGDLSCGYNMRPGDTLEVIAHGADAQINRIIDVVPYIGRNLYFILGNHDYSHFKRQGIDIGIHLSSLRDDFCYLGSFVESTVEFAENTKLMLSHPGGSASCYAVSYRSQKMIESFSGDAKPQLLGIGHFHKAEFLNYRNVNCWQTGCMENQSDWARGKGISFIKGGWIIDVWLKENGFPDKVAMEFYPYN